MGSQHIMHQGVEGNCMVWVTKKLSYRQQVAHTASYNSSSDRIYSRERFIGRSCLFSPFYPPQSRL